VKAAVLIGWRAEHDLFASGYLSRNPQHQHGGKQRGRSARYVQAHFFNGTASPPALDSRHGFDNFGMELLLGMESADILLGRLNGQFQFRA
jgi:hypothetical protein